MSIFPQPRTFGDLLPRPGLCGLCRFCKVQSYYTRKYSLRGYICEDCIAPRKDVVLPKIVKREKFQARLAKVAK